MWSGRICQEMSAKSTRGLRHEMPTLEGFSMRANEVPATTERPFTAESRGYGARRGARGKSNY